MHVSTLWWAGTFAAIIVLLALDLVVSGWRSHVGTRTAARWVIFYAAAALLFGAALWWRFGSGYAGQFVAGWLTEYSLSIDNLFVFLILMTRFEVPTRLQLRVLTFGVMIALVLRACLIAVGAVAIARFSWIFYIFGALLIHTAWTMVRGQHDDSDDDGAGRSEPKTVQLINRVLPNTPQWHGTKLVVHRDGRWLVTPLLLTMLTIGFTDVLFALDSIPAIFGLTTEAYLVISANAFALIGLRQLFFVVRGLLARLEHLSKGLALVLVFIGIKLILEALHENSIPFLNHGEGFSWAPEVPTWLSLGLVVAIVAITAATSLITSRRRERVQERERVPAQVR